MVKGMSLEEVQSISSDLKKNEEGKFVTEFTPFYSTVDLVVFTIWDGELRVLLVNRGAEPFKGSWALPGGFVSPNETLDVAAARELGEETGLVRQEPGFLEQLKTYYKPGRDPRMPTVSTAYIATVESAVKVEGGDDAADAQWILVDDILSGDVELAFDHVEILKDGITRLRSKFEYTTIATTFLESTFTLGDLRRVYEVIWGCKIHPSNFRRKVLSTAGFVEANKGKGESITGGNKAAIYIRGKAQLLHPAILNDNN